MLHSFRRLDPFPINQQLTLIVVWSEAIEGPCCLEIHHTVLLLLFCNDIKSKINSNKQPCASIVVIPT
jgi:hypothetical protein